MLCECHHCGASVEKATGHVNRAKRLGAKIFCDRECFGLSRRVDRSDAERKQLKREYDLEYYQKNQERLRREKAAYFKRTYDPVAAAVERKKKMPAHVEYCRRPEYRLYKAQYDKVYQAKKKFGEYWESHIALVQLEAFIAPDRHQSRIDKGTYNKSLQRKRNAKQNR